LNKEGTGMSEAEIIEKIRALRARGKADRAIREELGIPLPTFYYLLGKGGFRLRSTMRAPEITRVHVSRGQLGLWVSRRAVRQAGWLPGQAVRWRVKEGKIIGEPVE